MPPLTYHLIPRVIWEQIDRSTQTHYEPDSVKVEGFIHCTDGEGELTATANRHYQGTATEFRVLVLDRALIEAPVRYDDSGQIYPHIYGALNLNAVVKVCPMEREADGHFLPFVECA